MIDHPFLATVGLVATFEAFEGGLLRLPTSPICMEVHLEVKEVLSLMVSGHEIKSILNTLPSTRDKKM